MDVFNLYSKLPSDVCITLLDCTGCCAEGLSAIEMLVHEI